MCSEGIASSQKQSKFSVGGGFSREFGGLESHEPPRNARRHDQSMNGLMRLKKKAMKRLDSNSVVARASKRVLIKEVVSL